MSREEAIKILKDEKIIRNFMCPICGKYSGDSNSPQKHHQDCHIQRVIELLESEPERKSPLKYPWQIHIAEKTKEEYYVKLRALIPEDLFERTKKSEPEQPAGAFTRDLRERVKKSYYYFIIRHNLGDYEINYSDDEVLEACDRIDRLTAELKAKDEALQRIYNWSKAYPLKVFPKPTKDNFKQAAEVLKENGLSLDRISADNMRHVLEGVKDIVQQALKGSMDGKIQD